MKKLLLILIIFCNNSCDNKECYVDDVYVNKLVTLTDEEFEELQLNGSYKFIEGEMLVLLFTIWQTASLKLLIESVAINLAMNVPILIQ